MASGNFPNKYSIRRIATCSSDKGGHAISVLYRGNLADPATSIAAVIGDGYRIRLAEATDGKMYEYTEPNPETMKAATQAATSLMMLGQWKHMDLEPEALSQRMIALSDWQPGPTFGG